MEQKSVIVFVATHVLFNPPQNPIYVPLHVGREGKEDLGYLGDNVGENISDLNCFYGELTGLYWIWQNIKDIDYVGFCHYRRFFLNDRGQEMQREDYLNFLSTYDVIIPRHAECEGTYLEHFGRAHNRKDLEAVGRAVERLYPEYTDAFRQAMDGNIFYGGNLMVASLSLLKAYAEWLFTIFAEAAEEIDVSSYDNYHRRVYGFLSEQMFYVYLIANHLSYYEAVVGISQEKAETQYLRETIQKLLQEGRTAEARKAFEKGLEARPDLLLPGSDVYGDLEKLRKMIY